LVIAGYYIMKSTTPNSISEYISVYPENIQRLLLQFHETIRAAAPGAQEMISYQMPVYKLNGILVYFAAHKNHIGFYPGIAAIEAFAYKLKEYKTSKGTVQFQYKEPIPWKLVERMVKFKAEENLKKSVAKKKRKPV
jgi:uncharacterized protein YdhG (YjbR/CyaY superfamily)